MNTFAKKIFALAVPSLIKEFFRFIYFEKY